MNVIKLKELLPPGEVVKNLNDEGEEIQQMMKILGDNPRLVNTIVNLYKNQATDLNENALKSPKLLRALATMLLGLGITPDSFADDDIASKIKAAFNKNTTQPSKDDTPTVSFVMPPAKTPYDKAATAGAGKQYEKTQNFANIDEFIDKMAAAIYRAEGGAKAKSPYGVLSVNVKNKADAERVTKISIRNNLKRWNSSNKSKDFIDFMADRWCPIAADPVGNKNWKKNVKAMMPRVSSEELTRLLLSDKI